MKRRFGMLFYIFLFSILGLFSFLLLVNFTDISASITDSTNVIMIFIVYVMAFNMAGFATMQLSTWMNNEYSRNLRNRWKILSIYISGMLILLLLNYGLLVAIKLAASHPHPLYFQDDGLQVFLIVWSIEIIILGLLLTNRSISDNLRFQQQVVQLQKENDNARYVALQNQLNPHFLFNTLNTLIAEIEYNPKNAVVFTNRLADIYRYVLQVQEKPLVPLKGELEFMRAYLFLHKVRMGGYVEYHQDVPNEYLENMLPPLTLQLLVENIIKHNSITEKHNMTINIYPEGDFIVVSNTIKLKKNSTSNGVGLKNLSNRCRLVFGRDIEVTSDNQVFTVKIPLLYGNS